MTPDKDLLAPAHCILLVIDVQNDLCHADRAFGRAGGDLGPFQAAVRSRPAAGECVVVKHRYSGFVGARLPVALRALGRRDYQVVLVEDCAAALTKAEHDAAVHNIRTYFGRVLDAAAIEEHWNTNPAS